MDTPELDMSRLLTVNESVIYTQVEEEIVMLEPSDEGFHGLNPVAVEL